VDGKREAGKYIPHNFFWHGSYSNRRFVSTGDYSREAILHENVIRKKYEERSRTFLSRSNYCWGHCNKKSC